MTITLNVGDTIFTPCTNSTGEMWLEENEIIAIGDDFINFTHIATLRKRDNRLDRKTVTKTLHKGGKLELDYYSRPFDVIMKEYREENEWLVKQIQNLNNNESSRTRR
ncbi:MAG: hypothetical protein SFY92_03830 [Verrucomicrobiae bacterium]|nr:hypothetical protein [Verrucomicrobiae bacterium]